MAEKLGVETPVIPDAAPVADAPEAPPIDPDKYECVRDAGALQVWINRINACGYMAVDTETTGLDEMTAELVGICLSVEPGEACYVPLIHKVSATDDLFGSDDLAEGQMAVDEALDMLRPVLQDDAVLKIGQNMKYDAKILARYGVAVAPIDDTMLMSYAMNAGVHNHGMDVLSERYLDHNPISIKTLLGTGKSAITFDRVPLEDAVKYAAEMLM